MALCRSLGWFTSRGVRLVTFDQVPLHVVAVLAES
jgi:hypothetical protein